MGDARLNTRDRGGLVHVVRERPDDLKMGRTVCMKFFTWPIYSKFERESRWEGTHDHPTCLACVVCL